MSNNVCCDGKWDLENLSPRPELLDEDFFLIISNAYRDYLYPVRHGFGLLGSHQPKGQKRFNAGYAQYAEELLEKLTLWAEGRIKYIETNDRGLLQHVSILDTFPDRLDAVLVKELFVNQSDSMILPTNTPLLCAYMLTDLTDFFLRHVHGIMEVFRMLDPMYCDTINSKHAPDAYTILTNWVHRHHPELSPKPVIYAVCLMFAI
jgi:hypothetical protein